MVMLSAGLASFSSPPGAHCGSGRSLCLVIGLAGWWLSSPATSWSRAASMVSSVTRAIWGCSSTRWDGRSLFVRGSGYCSPCSLFRRSSRAFVLKSGCCVRSSAANTISTAPARRGSFPGSIEAGNCRRTILSPPGLGADGRSSRKHFGARWPSGPTVERFLEVDRCRSRTVRL